MYQYQICKDCMSVIGHFVSAEEEQKKIAKDLKEEDRLS